MNINSVGYLVLAFFFILGTSLINATLSGVSQLVIIIVLIGFGTIVAIEHWRK